jgi:hypothetical protein
MSVDSKYLSVIGVDDVEMQVRSRRADGEPYECPCLIRLILNVCGKIRRQTSSAAGFSIGIVK